jgi:hypothetical protein
MASDVARALAGVRIGAVLHPTMLLTLADRAGFLQQRDRPAAQRPDRGSSISRHQHKISPAGTNPCARHSFPAVSTGQGFEIVGAAASTFSAALRRAPDEYRAAWDVMEKAAMEVSQAKKAKKSEI